MPLEVRVLSSALPTPGRGTIPDPPGAVAKLAKAPVSKTGDSRFESWLPRSFTLPPARFTGAAAGGRRSAYACAVANGVKVREGYELWHPNREKAESKTMKAIVAFVLIISAVLLAIITLGGWERLQSSSVGLMTLGWAALYVLFAVLVMTRWQRGVLPVASAMAILMAIFAAVAADGWFARAKTGLDDPALPPDLLGVLTLVVIPVQLLLIIVAMIAFNQAWNVEEERPIGGGPRPDDAPPTPQQAAPAAAPEQTLVDEDPAPPPPGEPTYARREDDGWDDGGQVSPAI